MLVRSLHWSVWLALVVNVFTTYVNYVAQNLLSFGLGAFTLGYLVGFGVFAWMRSRADRRREQLELDAWLREIHERTEREIRGFRDAL